MKSVTALPSILSKMSGALKGVFCRSDLAHLFSTENRETLSKRIQLLIAEGHLKRAIQDFYYTPDANLMDIAQRIYHKGYFSAATALSYHAMVGTRSDRKVTILTTAPHGKTIEVEKGVIRMRRVQPEYYFGFQVQSAFKVATPEKAFIDSCYLYMRKERFPFDLSSDVDVNKLDLGLLKEMLEVYKNKRFVQFTLNMIEANGRQS